MIHPKKEEEAPCLYVRPFQEKLKEQDENLSVWKSYRKDGKAVNLWTYELTTEKEV